MYIKIFFVHKPAFLVDETYTFISCTLTSMIHMFRLRVRIRLGIINVCIYFYNWSNQIYRMKTRDGFLNSRIVIPGIKF